MSFILMDSKWSRWRMILTVTCHCHLCHIIWLGRCRWHSTWTFSGSVFQRLCQADVILNLLEQYNIVDQTFSVCCDTTSSNTSVFSGEIVLLCTILNTPLVVSLQEAHAGSKHLSLHWVLHWREDQGPLGGCVSNFRRSGQQSRMRLKTL